MLKLLTALSSIHARRDITSKQVTSSLRAGCVYKPRWLVVMLSILPHLSPPTPHHTTASPPWYIPLQSVPVASLTFGTGNCAARFCVHHSQGRPVQLPGRFRQRFRVRGHVSIPSFALCTSLTQSRAAQELFPSARTPRRRTSTSCTQRV